MNLKEKSQAVIELFNQLEMETQKYTCQSKLNCFKGCSQCCSQPNVSATVLEFLPLAFELHRLGKAEETLDQITSRKPEAFCIILKQLSPSQDAGKCSFYAQRGLICRLFGNAARLNKNGKRELITCKLLKEKKAQEFFSLSEKLTNGLNIPISRDFYLQLYSIDYHLAGQQIPINKAIQKSIEAVLSYYFYTEGEAV
ncbi:YkgJ family cysteine cluster protein [Echinicola jeungdonensis]|uniref:YkgJ family cysteine cluster protein n=1 Tax=Echinicola jeungdonensis TaxID=709343 RepID=A0ABV5J3H2_9BACT|nr:YkgJ family cysteine cluster protein [Echinicola jeungdonensis]MDN3669015.1 YkgJ family cysteine cluster protein [Echinicola jeungdonensis]